jgi:uncharacterized protein (TIGR02996 family)
MPIHPDRLALLRAIAAAPDEDTPRLAYADWLDESGNSDADRARAELLRIACRMKPKIRITKDEQKWLAEHWRRLLPTVSVRMTELGAKPLDHQWRGRVVGVWSFDPQTRGHRVWVGLEIWRGFVRHASYASGFEELAAAVVADEPLARHGIGQALPAPWRLADGRYRLGVTARICHGPAVWDRITGYQFVEDAPEHPRKMFEDSRRELLRRVSSAVSAAMTAQARHLAGWPEDLPTLGG